MQRAYSILELKSLDAERREFTGIATTPSTDRMGDVVEPRGAEFTLPLPLLLHHDSTKPVGNVIAANVTGNGITVRCRIADTDEPGTLKDRADEAWHSVKAGVIRGLSIGFRALQDGIEQLRTGGVRFTRLEILELSLVPIPANSDCTITAVKHYAQRHRIAPPTAAQRAAHPGAVWLADGRRPGRQGVQLISARGAPRGAA